MLEISTPISTLSIYDYGYIREPKEVRILRAHYEQLVKVYTDRGEAEKLISFEIYIQRKLGLVLRTFQLLNQTTLEFETVQRWCKLQPFKPSKEQIVKYLKWKQKRCTTKREAAFYEVPLTLRTKKETTGKKELERIAENTGDETITKCLEYRSVLKLIKNDLKNWTPHPDGRVHTTFRYVPPTGQLNSSGPNVQNASKHSELGQLFRGIVVAPEGYCFVELDYCVDPETMILTDDFTWKPAKAITIGEMLVGFDEYGTENPGEYSDFTRRRLRKSVVEDVKVINKPRVKIITDLGDVICSQDHMWLSAKSSNTTGYNLQWVQAKDIVLGNTISFLTDVWYTDNSRDGGYLAGLLDGEGHVSSACIYISQNEGEVLEEAISLLSNRGYTLTESKRIPNDGVGNFCTTLNITGYPYAAFRVVGSLRPKRLLQTIKESYPGMSVWGKRSKRATVTAVQLLLDGPVVAIETSTKTFIANGFLSHNCRFHICTMGRLANDPNYIRFGQNDSHSIFTSYVVNHPIEFTKLSDTDLKSAIKEFRSVPEWERERNERCKHALLAINNGAGPRKVWWMNKRFIHSTKEAEVLHNVITMMFPKVEQFKKWVCDKAHEQTYLLDAWGQIRWFHEVFRITYNKRYNTWEKLNGSEHEEAISYQTQSDAFGMIKEKMKLLEVMEANEEFSFNNTIHDSLVFMPELGKRDKCIEAAYSVMSAPCKRLSGPSCPNGLVVGVDVTWGKVWRKYDRERNPDGMREVII